MKNVVKFAAAAVFAMAAPSLAQATTQEFQFDFTSAPDSVSASGLFTVAANNEVTAITGTVSNSVLGPQTITGIVGNPNFPGPNGTGGFTYDNLYKAGDPVFDISGILSRRPAIRAAIGTFGAMARAALRCMHPTAPVVIRSRKAER